MLARNRLDDPFSALAALIGLALCLRGAESLCCEAEEAPKTTFAGGE
jgi:hypothetical protein